MKMFSGECIKLTVSGNGRLVAIELQTGNVAWATNNPGTSYKLNLFHVIVFFSSISKVNYKQFICIMCGIRKTIAVQIEVAERL